MDFLPEMLLVLGYLNNNGGKEVAKKASMDVYEWVKSKLPSKSKAKIEALKEKPEDKTIQLEAQKTLAAEMEKLDKPEFEQQMKKLKALLKKEDPEWLQKNQMQYKQNTQTNTGDNNMNFQDISGSTININKD
ncbi:MAG: hypothetical protein CMO01_26615 [Thalassobius sp.]|nr:hypothetical protein [Thalassovita sp.]